MNTADVFAVVGSILLGAAVGLGSIPTIALIDRLNRAYRADLADRMARVGMSTEVLDQWLRGRIIGAIVAWLVTWLLLGMLPVGIGVAVFVYIVVPLILERAVLKHRSLIRDQLVTAVRQLASRLRGSGNLSNALVSVAADTPPPLGDLLNRTLFRYQAGMADLPEVLKDLKEQLRMDTVSLFTIAVCTAYERGGGGAGGGFAEVLDGIAVTLEENQRIERKREADTAAGRLLVNLLAVFPFGFLGLFALLDPEGTGAVFSTVLGQLMLCGVGGLSYLALWLARKILGESEV